jgi:signal peptidase
MTFNEIFQKIKKLLLAFWNSDNSKIALIRDIVISMVLVMIILMALWTYTGQWFAAPMVAIESGSMMHLDEPFGRYGTIDAGDMVLLVKVNNKNDIVPYSEKNSDEYHYQKYGDVIIYKPLGNEERDQIIHRAMCWVEVKKEDGKKTYTIDGYITDHPADEKLFLPELGIRSPNYPYENGWVVNWTHSGYITKGDNPNTNPTCDQIGGICPQPIKIEWVSGKARFELPWIGSINLLFNDIVGGKSTLGNVPQDSLICLIILIVVIISIPISMDIYTHLKENKKKYRNN